MKMKDLLLKFKIVAGKYCIFCNSSEETVMHTFLYCPYLKIISSGCNFPDDKCPKAIVVIILRA